MKMTKQAICINEKLLLSLDVHDLDPGFEIPVKHWHPWLEISYAKCGSGEYTICGDKYDVKEGDIFIFNNIEHHSLKILPPSIFTNVVIHFEPSFICFLESDSFDYRYLKIFFDRNENFKNRLDRDNPATNKIKELFLEIVDEFSKKLPDYDLMVKIKLMTILTILIRQFNYTNKKQSTSYKIKKELGIVNNVINFINENFTQDISIKSLEKITFVEASYFTKIFKKYNGISPSRYLCIKRITRAIEYLENTNKTILEIATLCGFNNTTNFNKIFKKVTNKTPSEFRK
ncbi:MAG TPA: AraC family transcriptional regulator [Clostridiaceae bacterium]